MSRAALWIAALLSCSPLLAQARGKAELDIDYPKLQRQKAEQALREGKLINSLVRHAFGLPVDDIGKFELESSEQAANPDSLKAQLSKVRAETEKRAQELARFRAAHPDLMDPMERVTAGPEGAPAVARKPGAEIPHGQPGERRNISSQPPARPIADLRPQPQPRRVGHPTQAKARRPEPREAPRAYIRSSTNRVSHGRILYLNKQYREAITEFGDLEKDPRANLESLFFLARSHEQLHRQKFIRAAQLAGEHEPLPKDAEFGLKQLEEQIKANEDAYEAMRREGRHSRFEGASERDYRKSQQLLAEVKRLQDLQEAITAEVQTLRDEQSKHFEEADKIYKLIEVRDTRSVGKKKIAGSWAQTAMAARRSLEWNSTRLLWKGSTWHKG